MKEVPEYAREKVEEEKERMKSGDKRKYEERSPKPPNPAWGMEDMKKSSLKDPEAKTQVHEVKGSDEEKIKEKEAKEAAGSSKDKPKDKKEKKEEKEKNKKQRRADDSSEIEAAAAKKRKDEKQKKNDSSDLE